MGDAPSEEAPAEDAASWRRTAAYLDHALGLLAAHAANTPDLINHLARHHDWMSRNELEPALDALLELGDRYGCARGYWLCLRQAIVNMRLPHRLPRLDQRLRPVRGRTPLGQEHP